MIRFIKKWFFICYNNRILRYIFYGGLTTLVNWGVFFLLRKVFHAAFNPANAVSVVAAILFAYFVNSRFVFETRASSFSEHLREFLKFISGRALTMIVEIGGGWLLVEVLGWNETLVKIVLLQVIVLVLNYIISRFIVFRK